MNTISSITIKILINSKQVLSISIESEKSIPYQKPFGMAKKQFIVLKKKVEMRLRIAMNEIGNFLDFIELRIILTC